MVEISPAWVTGPEQGKSSGRIATFSLWTGMFRDGISSISGETDIPLSLLLCENKQQWEQEFGKKTRLKSSVNQRWEVHFRYLNRQL